MEKIDTINKLAEMTSNFFMGKAREYGLSGEEITEAATNLEIGFRILRGGDVDE